MTTTDTHIRRHARLLQTLTIVLTCIAAALGATAAPAGTNGATAAAKVGALRLVSTTHSPAVRTWSYTWPVKPFDRQHAVRAFLDDPRIAKDGSSRSFHFGIDISVPDGTAVYAVEAGTVFMDSGEALGVIAPSGHGFAYWHIVPVVKHRQWVRRHQLLGRVGKGWEHVHFAERVDGHYVNPLRNGGLGPYVDHTVPRVARIGISGSALVAAAFDMADLPVPGAWKGLPVTPALVRWRVAGGAWHTVVDSRLTMLPKESFTTVFAPAIRQNRKHTPGFYAYYLQRDFKTTRPVRVEVAVSDASGNRSVVSALVGVGV